MTISLNSFTSGMTDYIAKHNANYSAIQAALNLAQADIDAMKASSAPGGDLDYRLLAFNMMINGGMYYWQRGTTLAPDAWTIENAALGATVARESSIKKVGLYSAKTIGIMQLTQALPSEFVLAMESGHTISVGVYSRTSTADIARIGVYNGITTTWSDYNSGSDEWEWLFVRLAIDAAPDSIKIVLDSGNGTVYWNGAVAIRGNPASGPIYVENDPEVERLRVLSLYETGSTRIRGVGLLVAGDRELEQRITFAATKRSTPTVTITSAIETGIDIVAENVDRNGFNLLVAEIGGASATDGFVVEGIEWKAEI